MTQILMTGATGNTGSKVLRKLLESDEIQSAQVFVRSTPLDEGLERDPRVTKINAELEDIDSWRHFVTPDHIFVETANLRFGVKMLPHLEELGVRRAHCVTTTAVFSSFHSYSRLYREIEDRYRSSSLDITLLRPSMIYGNERDHNMHKLIRFIEKSPVFPMFGGGEYLMHPVFVDDLARGIAESVLIDAYGEFNLAGAKPLMYKDVVRTIVEQLQTNTLMVPVNHRLAAKLVSILQRVPGFPIKHEQVMRLVEDKAFDIEPAREALDYQPRGFAEGIAAQLSERTGSKL